MIPTKIKIKSDGNILEFVSTLKKGKEEIHNYKYTKSITKKGQLIPLTSDQITKLLTGIAEEVTN